MQLNHRNIHSTITTQDRIDHQTANCQVTERKYTTNPYQETVHKNKTMETVEQISLAERFKIYNSIDQFRPFQIEVMEKLCEFMRIAISIDTGIGKTTMMKYLALDFVDINPPENMSLILVNTRALTYDISQSIGEILEPNERGILCNLNDYDADKPLTQDIIHSARIFVGVPDKYLKYMKRLPKQFKFLCVDEVDALLDKEDPQSSSIIRIFDSIICEYSLVCSATLSQDVYTYVIDKYDYVSREFKANIPKIDIKRINYDKYDKYWHTYICDKIHHIILENPLLNKVIVFCNYRNDCDKLYNEYKTSVSLPNYCIHGNMSGQQIQQLFKSYKSNGKVLFTTDMCQRGLDVKDIDIIFHVGITGETEFYHRNGRTLRKTGSAPLCFIFTQQKDLHEFPSLKEIPEKVFEFASYTKYKY